MLGYFIVPEHLVGYENCATEKKTDISETKKGYVKRNLLNLMVARPGIEPGTQGFSIQKALSVFS